VVVERSLKTLQTSGDILASMGLPLWGSLEPEVDGLKEVPGRRSKGRFHCSYPAPQRGHAREWVAVRMRQRRSCRRTGRSEVDPQ